MTAWFTVATLVSTDSAVNHGWCTPFGCVSEAVIAQALLVVGALALICFALATLSFVPEARSIVREERSRTAAERDAFSRFRRRVASLEVTSPGTLAGGGSVTGGTPGAGTLAIAGGGGGGGPNDSLASVREAYRATVMDVDHYEVEYDEPLPVNLAAEFGEGVADALVDGGALTPALQSTLVSEAREATERRDRLCRALDCEAETLGDAAGTLHEVESVLEDTGDSTLALSASYGTLTDRWDRLQASEQTVEELLATQQASVRESYGVAPRLGGPVALHEYLYADESYTHPVLAEATELLDEVRTAQDRTATALARRV